MKKTKRMLTLLLALVMVLAMSATAFAGTITIENGADGETYTAYKVFDVTYSVTGTDEDGNDVYGYAYTISTSSAFFEWIQANGSTYGITLTQSAGDENVYVVTVDDSFSAKTFAEALAAVIADETIEVNGSKIEYGNGDGQDPTGGRQFRLGT